VTGQRRPPLPEGPYLVVGLARSGTAAARMLRERGEVIGVDTGRPDAPEGIEVHLESDGIELLERVACVVKSPGVPREAPAIAAALERGIPVYGELELAWRALANTFLAVTGTNGKTTTAELLGAIHRAADLPVVVAGNVGTPLASLVGDIEPEAAVVCEVSSFQAEDSEELRPDCAVLLNITEDHLDRHGSFEAYREAKLKLFANQVAEDVAVVPPDIEVPGQAARVTFGGRHSDLALRDRGLSWRGDPLIAGKEVRLRGGHNLENAMAAAAAALSVGIPASAVRAGLASFAGVPHRMEEVGTVGAVLYVNDSKATNVSSAARAIESFDGGVHVILGGSLKGGGFTGLREAVAARCKACYLIGEASGQLAEDLAGTVPLHDCGSLEPAVQAATRAAETGDVVLLSPACASYDQYRDFEERGEHFRSLVPAA
jgi:UDP-N-acetylmuramoylalanine--D-glutamate ligase